MPEDQPQELDIHELNDLRRRIVSGEDWSRQELRRALQSIRIDKERKGQKAQSNGGSTKSKPANLDDLL